MQRIADRICYWSAEEESFLESQVSKLDLFFEQMLSVFRSISIIDILDILIVAFLIYKLISFISETRAGQLIKGVIAILLLYAVADIFNFKMLETLLKLVVTYGAFMIIIVFQPELRKVLERMGRTTIDSLQVFTPSGETLEKQRNDTRRMINAITEAVSQMSKDKTGALIIIERTTMLGDIIGTGTLIDATPSSELIENIFFKNSPLHDGAMIMRDNKLYAAGCYLPLSQNYEISRSLGTRHRAGLGISEVSDGYVIIVSEETGHISVAENGKITTGMAEAKLKTNLYRNLMPVDENKNNKTFDKFKKLKFKKKNNIKVEEDREKDKE